MPDQRSYGGHRGEVEAFAAGRWPVVVRTLVLLGAPLSHAPVLAAEAAGRFLQRSTEDQWVDLDVVLAAEVVGAWEDDTTTWWTDTGQQDDAEADLVETLQRLDLLDPVTRARLVLASVAGLTADQLDAVLGPDSTGAPALATADELAWVAASVPVDDARLDEARTRGVRRRHGRGAVLAGGAAALVGAVAVVALAVDVVDPQPAESPDAATPTASDGSAAPVLRAPPVGTTRGPDLTPVAWYDGRRVHLRGRSVPVPGVRAMVRVGDGVVAVDAGGLVLRVNIVGYEPVGRTGPGAVVVADAAQRSVAWVDASTGDVVVDGVGAGAGTAGSQRVLDVPAGSRVVALDRDEVFVDGPTGPRRLDLDGEPLASAPAGLLDVAGGTQVAQSDASTLTVTRPGAPALRLDGVGARIADGGGVLLTRDVDQGSAPLDVVYDLRTGQRLPVPLPAGAIVVDAAFDPAGRVTFVLARTSGSRYAVVQPGESDDLPPGFDLVVCDLDGPEGADGPACQGDASLVLDPDAPPVLAG